MSHDDRPAWACLLMGDPLPEGQSEMSKLMDLAVWLKSLDDARQQSILMWYQPFEEQPWRGSGVVSLASTPNHAGSWDEILAAGTSYVRLRSTSETIGSNSEVFYLESDRADL